MIETILGSLYGGVVSVPLNPTTASGQVAHVLDHCGAHVVVVAPEQRELIRSAALRSRRSIRVVDYEEVGYADSPVPGAGLPEPRGRDEALLVYTSGTTALPKGVLHAHRNLALAPHKTAARLKLGAADRLLCVLPFHHLNAVNTAILVLTTRGSIVVAPQFEPALFGRQVDQANCSWASLVPTMLAQLIEYGSDSENSAIARMRFVRSSSAPLTKDLQKQFEEMFGVPVLQGMGMTEAGAVIFQNPAPPATNKIASLGLPCGFDVRVLDEAGNVLGPGGTGELVIRGPTTMKGYRGDPDATRKVLDPEGWLRTGEQGYRDSDGYYFSTGRVRELIIKGGTNIAPAEIDEALAAHPDVAEAACVGAPDRYLGEEIVAFVVLTETSRNRPPAEATLLDFCEERVGAFKTPAAIHFVESLPRGPSGKVQRLQLRELLPPSPARPSPGPVEVSAQPAGKAFAAPRTPLERALERTWAAFLERDKVGIRDDFFALGGYSLLAVRMFSHLRRGLGIQVPLGLCFEQPTIEGQALAVLKLLQKREGDQRSLISVADREVVEERLLAKLRNGGTRGRSAVRSRVAAVPLARSDNHLYAPRLFCAYGPSQYRDLALRLTPRWRVYGLFGQREVDILSEPAAQVGDFPTIEDFAELYCEAVRQTQPTGPYYLAGFSFGGRVALEMARRLRAAGDDVPLLVIFDTYMPGTLEWNGFRWAQDIIWSAPRRLRALASRRSRESQPVDAVPKPASKISREIAAAGQCEVEIRNRARTCYEPAPYEGRVLLIRAQDQRAVRAGYRTNPCLGWERIAGPRLSVRESPGSHLTILRKPAVDVVAEILLEHLGAP